MDFPIELSKSSGLAFQDRNIARSEGYQYLKPQQREAAVDILKFIVDDTRREYLLKGYAGTGKTTLNQILVKFLQHVNPEYRVAQCAFTNRARKVLKRKAHEIGLSIPSYTCCQVLGQKKTTNWHTGELEFRADPESPGKVKDFHLVVVDEALQNESTIHELFKSAGTAHDVKLLYLGDYAQLGPINELDSTIATVPGSELTEVIRYDGPTLDWATDIRNNLRTLRPLPSTSASPSMTEGLFNLDRDVWMQTLMKAAKNYRQGEMDSIQTLVFTNARRKQLNEVIRNQIYRTLEKRDRLSTWEPGDMITFEAPYGDKFYKSDDGIIEKITPTQKEAGGILFDAYAIEVWHDLYLDRPPLSSITVLAPQSQAAFNKRIDECKKRRAWQERDEIIESFAQIDYGYSRTTHGAQGGTYGDVFVDVQDLRKILYVTEMSNRKKKIYDDSHILMYNRILYTAGTRSSKRLFLGS